MDLTKSYERHIPADLLVRYQFAEVRNAAAVLSASNPDELASLIEVLRAFSLTDDMLLTPGGSKGMIAKTLDSAFREDSWREARVDVVTQMNLRLFPYGPSEKKAHDIKFDKLLSEGYKVDNFRGRVALDVEWNAKDGNLDRDVGAYRSFYDLGLIDCAVIITRTLEDLREYAQQLALKNGRDEKAAKRLLNTSTTTNLSKLLPRLTRGDGGGCPILAVAISRATAQPHV